MKRRGGEAFRTRTRCTDRFDRIFRHDRSSIETSLVDVPPPFLLAITMAFWSESKADAMALDCCRDKRLGCTPACTISVAIKHVYYPATVIQPGESLMLPR